MALIILGILAVVAMVGLSANEIHVTTMAVGGIIAISMRLLDNELQDK